MTKNYIMLTLGAVVLAAAGGILVGRGNAKFATPTQLYYTVGATCKQLFSSITVINHRLTTVNPGGCSQAKIFTVGGGSRFLYATSNCVKAVYFLPNR